MFASASEEKSARAAKEAMMNEGGAAANEAREKARRFRDDIRDTAKNVEENLEEGASRLKRDAYELGRNAHKAWDSAEHKIEDMGTTLAERVREKPISSIAIAVAVGFFASVLFRRR